MAMRVYDGHAILWIEACRRLERAGWTVLSTDDGMHLRNGQLEADLLTVDSLGSLMSADEVEEQIWRLRRAINARKR